MKLISWNVNGYNSALSKGFLDYVASENPEVICLQETKGKPEAFAKSTPAGYTPFWNPARKPGYSGTAIFTRHAPINVTPGLNGHLTDLEGRVLTAEYRDFFLVTVYSPNSKRELLRLDYRVNEWEPAFLTHITTLEQKKPVVFCGDLNVAHREIDLANPKENRRNAGFTDEERARFDRMIDAGFVDSFRAFETGPGHYSWWTFRSNARARNIGWRLDYFLVSSALQGAMSQAFIRPEIFGSDHCPVGLLLDGVVL